jgi:diacylglycerol O-acyltransferase
VRPGAARPRRALRSARRALDGGELQLAEELRHRAGALADLARWSLPPASASPLNGELSPHRRFDWLTMPLDDVRELRRVLECTVNDIVLATVAGALRRYLVRRRVDPGSLDFRLSAPVNVRRTEHQGQPGNHVSAWILRLPLGEPDPLERLAAIGRRTAELKRSRASLALETIMSAAEWLPAPVLSAGVGLVRGPVNMIVTNVPGPQFPLYSVGSRLLAIYPKVPLIPGGGLGIALFSYEGKLCWGFNADYQLVPDLRDFVADLRDAFEELRRATVARFMARRTAAPEAEAPPPPATARPRRNPTAAEAPARSSPPRGGDPPPSGGRRRAG